MRASRRQLARFASALAALAAWPACRFDFGFDGTRYRCGAGDRCPAGQMCVAGFCELEPDAIANFVAYVQLTLPGTGGRTRLETTLENGSLEYRLYVSDTIMDRRTYVLDRTMHRYWRTRGDGVTAIFETSPDRGVWTERWRVNSPFALSPVELNIGAGHYNTVTVPLSAMVPGVNAD